METPDGDIVIRPVERPETIRGDLAADAEDDRSATEELRSARKRDTTALDADVDDAEQAK